jgi:hypothetical protein
MNGNGQTQARWGVAVEGEPPTQLALALQMARRNGDDVLSLQPCEGESCDWVRRIAECLRDGTCQGAVLFCDDAGLACCVANKVKGVRAAAAASVPQAGRALDGLGVNLLVVEPEGRTFYELKRMLQLCCARPDAACPPGVACVLQELDGHAHR